jgi:23S rRNA maturation mini-RNase III
VKETEEKIPRRGKKSPASRSTKPVDSEKYIFQFVY